MQLVELTKQVRKMEEQSAADVAVLIALCRMLKERGVLDDVALSQITGHALDITDKQWTTKNKPEALKRITTISSLIHKGAGKSS